MVGGMAEFLAGFVLYFLVSVLSRGRDWRS